MALMCYSMCQPSNQNFRVENRDEIGLIRAKTIEFKV